MRLGTISICVAVALMATPSFASTCYNVDFSTYGGRLKEGMTEDQVVQAMGFQANNISLSTCGASSKDGAWQCKIEVWGSTCRGDMRIYFQKVGEVWIINNWNAEEALGY
jgi:hypothetical protein